MKKDKRSEEPNRGTQKREKDLASFTELGRVQGGMLDGEWIKPYLAI